MFESKLLVEVPLDGGDRILLQDLVYFSKLADEEIIAEKGMSTDYGSIPKILHSVISPTGKATYGYVIHDQLYQSGKYSRSKSDKILDEANVLLGVGWLKRKSINGGLRVGGWVSWRNYRRSDSQK